jgi:hypothetical protein
MSEERVRSGWCEERGMSEERVMSGWGVSEERVRRGGGGEWNVRGHLFPSLHIPYNRSAA